MAGNLTGSSLGNTLAGIETRADCISPSEAMDDFHLNAFGFYCSSLSHSFSLFWWEKGWVEKTKQIYTIISLNIFQPLKNTHNLNQGKHRFSQSAICCQLDCSQLEPKWFMQKLIKQWKWDWKIINACFPHCFSVNKNMEGWYFIISIYIY